MWTGRAARLCAAAAASALALAAGCGDGRDRASGSRPDRPHLVLVVIDTLRADHLGSYGYHRETSPEIDALAAQGLRFERVIAPSSWTLPSLVALMTGRHPNVDQIGVLDPSVSPRGMDALASEEVTLAERLAAAGYRTAAVGTNPYQMQPVFQLMQGFESLEIEVRNSASWVVDRGIAQLDEPRADAPLFLYLHFMDAHSPYEPPPRFAAMFPDRNGAPPSAASAEPRGLAEPKTPLTPQIEAQQEQTVARYDAGIRFIDHELGRFVEALERRGLRDDTVLVITADHGEAFWDHAALEQRLGLQSHPDLAYGAGHGQSLFPELIQVPLVIQGPGVPEATVSRQVRLIDVPSTLLALAGLPADAAGGPGIDLLRFARDPQRDLRSLSETSAGRVALRALVTPEHTLLEADGEPLLLHEVDRKLHDVTQRQPALLAPLRQELAEETQGLARAGAAQTNLEWSDLAEQLRELGYVLE